MSNSILVTRPNYDITTNYLFHWTKQVISFSKKRNITTYDLYGSKATRSNLESYYGKRKPKIIFLNGHGSSDVITGQDDEAITDFIFYRNDNFSTKPLKDPIAKYFLEPSNLVMTTIIKGNSVKEADKRSKRSMKKNFLKLLTSTSSADEREIAPYLWSNIRAQVVLGDETATIT